MKSLVTPRTSIRRSQAAVFAGIAVIAAVVVTVILAAGTPTAFEAESGIVSVPDKTVADSTASGGSAVQFGLSTTATPVPTSTPVAGACPAFPAFPDASCTGWQHTGVVLKAVPAQLTSGSGWSWEGAPLNYVKISASGAVLDGLDISGCIYVDPSVTGFTLKRSRVTGNCDYLLRFDDTSTPVASNIVDTELVGSAVQQKGAGFTWTRVNAHGFTGKAAMLGSGATVQDSWIHDNVCNPPDHQSAIGTNGGASNMVMRHNNVDLTPSDCTSGGISNYDDFGAFHNIVIENNLMNSAGYCLKAGFEDNNAAGNSGEQVINNVFGRKYNAECGTFGVVSNWMPAVSGNVWSGNTWGGGAAATGTHTTGSTVTP